jgi:DNA gyrase inhibitor GyrI/AraC-like DNA-binding protein
MKAGRSEAVYLSRINRVIDHISTHLAEPLPLARLARLAHFSPFHFHRIFRSLVGEPLHAFVRRLRLERAVFQMAHGPAATLTEIALRCGFGSSSDFSRAFRQAYGFRPRDYSRERFLQESKIRQDLWANARYDLAKLPRARNPDRFRVRLVDQPARRIGYVRVIGGYNAEKILGGFRRLMDWGRRHGLVPGATLIGMSQDDPEITPMAKYRFDWCLVLPDGLTPDGNLFVIPANRFAVLHCRGDIHKEDRAWQYLFHTWLPRSGYQPTQDPAMEVYRAHPLKVGWNTFDLDCCVPVKPLARR